MRRRRVSVVYGALSLVFLFSGLVSAEPVATSGSKIERLVREFAEKIEAAGYTVDDFEQMLVTDAHGSSDEAILRFYIEERLKQVSREPLPRTKPRKTTGATNQRGLTVETTFRPSPDSVKISLADAAGMCHSSVTLQKDTDLVALLGEEFSDSAALDRLSETDGASPFSVSIRGANGTEYPVAVRDDCHTVRIPTGMTYSIILENRSYKTISAAVFVDGINTIYQVRELPSSGLKWVIDPLARIAITGWQMTDSTSRAFRVTSTGDSVAAAKGLEYAVGVITVVFFETEHTTPSAAGVGRGVVGTGAGNASANAVSEVASSGDKRAIQIVQLWYSE